MVRCSYCSVDIQPGCEHVECHGCKSHYCFGCGLKESAYKSMSEEKLKAWRCQHKCKAKSSSVISKQSTQTNVHQYDIKDLSQFLTTKMDGFESILKEVKESQNFIFNKYDEIMNELKDLKKAKPISEG